MRRAVRLLVLAVLAGSFTIAVPGVVIAAPSLPKTLIASESLSASLAPGSERVFEAAMPWRANAVGVSFLGPDRAAHGVTLEMRTHEGSGWSSWTPIDVNAEPGPDGAEARRAGGRIATDAQWVGTADGVQVRVTLSSIARPIRDVKLHLINSLGDAHPQSLVSRVAHAVGRILSARVDTQPAAAMTTQPAIISRAQWGADPSLMHPPGPGLAPTVVMAFVHHTDTTNSYTPSQSAAIVRSIYAYHTQSLGYYDIAYNFLVDRYGQIFEGRSGGIDKPVIGAHTGGFNYESTGVALLGTFSTATPPSAMLSSLENLLAWKLDLTHVPPIGSVSMTAGPNNDKYAQGTVVTFNRISGHRDASLTDCPGTAAYSLLGAIRNAVSGIGNPKIYLPSASGNLIRPSLGPSSVTVSASFSQPVSWLLTITDGNGIVQRTFSGSGTTMSQPWDGTANGVVLPTGLYNWQIDADVGSAPARPADGDVYVVGAHPTGTLLSDASGSYVAQGSTRLALDAVTQTSRFGTLPAVAAGASERGWYSDGGSMTLRDGTLLVGPDGTYYIWSANALRKFASDPTSGPLGYQSSAAIAVTQTYLDSLPSGADVNDQTVHPAGTVVRDAGTGAMWVIGAGVRLPATALAVAASYRASEIVTATAGDEALPLGAPYQVRDGSLVAASDGGAPWLVEGGMKHRFADAFLFASMGYTNAMLLSAAPTDLNAIPTGAPYGTVPTPGISLFGDWNHGGADTLGVVRDNLVSLRYTNTTGPPDVFFTYGLSGDRFIAGDWNGGGVDTVGVIRGNTIYLRNSNTSGVADQVFQFGSAGDQFIVGDWNGDGVDTIGVIRGNTIYLRNSNTSGVADQVFQFGSAGDRYIVGDWNGDGVDTLGVVRGNTVYLRDSNSTGVADVTFSYGVPADTFVAGDWNGDGQDTVGVVRGNVYYLRNTNTTGAADTVLVSAM